MVAFGNLSPISIAQTPVPVPRSRIRSGLSPMGARKRSRGSRPEIAEANVRAFKAGHAYGETTESFSVSYEVAPAAMSSGTYRNISGNLATAYGLVAASQLSGLPLFLGSYPITPTSDILHELSKHKNFGIRTLQAEDEIAGIGAALGAAFGGHLACTTTSGPGIALKTKVERIRERRGTRKKTQQVT